MNKLEAPAGEPFLLNEHATPEEIAGAFSERFPWPQEGEDDFCIFILDPDSGAIYPYKQFNTFDTEAIKASLTSEECDVLFGDYPSQTISMHRITMSDSHSEIYIHRGSNPNRSGEEGLHVINIEGKEPLAFFSSPRNRMQSVEIFPAENNPGLYVARVYRNLIDNRRSYLTLDFAGHPPDHLDFVGIHGDPDQPGHYLSDNQLRVLLESIPTPFDWQKYIREFILSPIGSEPEISLPTLNFSLLNPNHDSARTWCFLASDQPETLERSDSTIRGIALDSYTSHPHILELTIETLTSIPSQERTLSQGSTLISGTLMVEDVEGPIRYFKIDNINVHRSIEFTRTNPTALLAELYRQANRQS